MMVVGLGLGLGFLGKGVVFRVSCLGCRLIHIYTHIRGWTHKPLALVIGMAEEIPLSWHAVQETIPKPSWLD